MQFRDFIPLKLKLCCDKMAEEISLEELSSRFKWPEYIVFAVMLAVSAGIGLFYGCFGKGQKTTSEFLMAGRSMSTFPAAMSLIAR